MSQEIEPSGKIIRLIPKSGPYRNLTNVAQAEGELRFCLQGTDCLLSQANRTEFASWCFNTISTVERSKKTQDPSLAATLRQNNRSLKIAQIALNCQSGCLSAIENILKRYSESDY